MRFRGRDESRYKSIRAYRLGIDSPQTLTLPPRRALQHAPTALRLPALSLRPPVAPAWPFSWLPSLPSAPCAVSRPGAGLHRRGADGRVVRLRVRAAGLLIAADRLSGSFLGCPGLRLDLDIAFRRRAPAEGAMLRLFAGRVARHAAHIATQRRAVLGPPWLPLHVATGVESPLLSPNTSLLARATMLPSPNTNQKKSVTAVDLRTPL